MEKFFEPWRRWAKQLRVETYALYLAYQDPRVPAPARIFALCVVGYAFSPIDLIPDFIPILGYLDDLILIPLGIKIALSMIPEDIMEESRKKAGENTGQAKPVNWVAAVVIVLIWLALLALVINYIIRAG